MTGTSIVALTVLISGTRTVSLTILDFDGVTVSTTVPLADDSVIDHLDHSNPGDITVSLRQA